MNVTLTRRGRIVIYTLLMFAVIFTLLVALWFVQALANYEFPVQYQPSPQTISCVEGTVRDVDGSCLPQER